MTNKTEGTNIYKTEGVGIAPSANNTWRTVSILLGAMLMFTGACLFYQWKNFRATGPSDNHIKHDIACFVDNIRSVPSDPIVVRKKITKAYAFTTRKAKRQLDKMIKGLNLSDKLSRRITISVDISSIKLKSSSLCVVGWTETVFVCFQQAFQTIYEGYFRIKFAALKSQKNGYLVNPSGVYVNNIKIEEVKDNNPKS